VQFGGEAIFVSRSGSGGKTFTEFGNFFGASAAAANFWATAGCGHYFLLALCVSLLIIELISTSGKEATTVRVRLLAYWD
jgi:hypothetical protein